MQMKARQMMTERNQSVQPAVKLMREDGQRMPVAVEAAREGAHRARTGQAPMHIGIFADINRIVMTKLLSSAEPNAIQTRSASTKQMPAVSRR